MHIIRLLVIVSFVILTGCSRLQRPITQITETVAPEPKPAVVEPTEPVVSSSDDVVAKRFQQTSEDTPSAVETALMWSKRYDDLSQTVMKLRETNNTLTMQNSQLKQENIKAVADLKQAQKELSEANEFMAQMYAELAQWKKDVLGFRSEMRDAQATQLLALSNIMKTLGAEPIEIKETKTDE